MIFLIIGAVLWFCVQDPPAKDQILLK